MLGSITPLGERGRRQRWTATVAAFVTGSAVYLTFVATFLSGSAAGGAAVGAAFGLLRSLPTVATAGIHRPGQLVRLEHRVRTWDRPSRRLAGLVQAALAAGALLLAMPR